MGDSQRLRIPSLDPQHRRVTERALPKEPGVPRLYDPSVHNDATRVLKADELEAITRPPPADGEDEPAEPSGIARTVPDASGKSIELVLAHEWDLAEGAEPAAQSEVRVASDVVPSQTEDMDVELAVGPPLELDLDDLEPPPVASATRTVAPRPTPPPPSRPASAPPSSPASVAPASGLTLTQRQSIPRLLVSPTEMAKLPIDHRGGFLLTHIDGMHTLEEILDICAMPAAEALEILRNLEAHRVIEFD